MRESRRRQRSTLRLFDDKSRRGACDDDVTKNIVITFHWKVMHDHHVTSIYVTAYRKRRTQQRDEIIRLCFSRIVSRSLNRG